MSADKKEEKKAAAPAEELTPEQEAAKKKKKLIILGAVGALLVIGLGVAAFLFMKGGKKAPEQEVTPKTVEQSGEAGEKDKKAAETKPDDKAKAEEKKEKEDPAKKDPKAEEKKPGDKAADPAKAGKEKEEVVLDIDFGETYKLPPFSLNLGNSLENRYIRIEIQLEYPRGNSKLKAEIEARQPQLRDAVIGIIQRKTREFLLSPDGKESLRREILKRINQYMSVPITNVYITDFLIE